jgi:hypothetical protein
MLNQENAHSDATEKSQKSFIQTIKILIILIS